MVRIRMAALGLALGVGAASLAGAQSTTTPQAPATAGVKKERAEGKRAHRGRHEAGPGRLFRGITLTDAQRARIEQIHESYRSQWRQLRESARPAMQEVRAARQRGDTAAAKAAFAKTASTRDQLKALRDKETAEVRGVLTADQQKLFDANRAEMQKKMQDRAARRRDRKA